jgi:phage terminase small subunit
MPKLKNGLTQKMKDFCHAYARTGNATEAYLEAYSSTSRNAAYIESCKLLKRDDVTEYMAEINRPTINKITNDREKKRNILWKGIERCVAKEDESGAARYMDILNKMDSEYVNINHNITDGETQLANLDTEQLKALLEQKTDS